MKILIRQFLGKNHSWKVFGCGIASSLISAGHQVDLFSTDGKKHLPKELEKNLVGYWEENKPDKVYGRLPDQKYDCRISYTCMKNFPQLLSSGTSNRLGVWCYEWSGKNSLPTGFAKYYKSCDYICAPSNYAKRVFLDSGIPEKVIKVIPHGISITQGTSVKKLTDKSFKILVNNPQLHTRKNIPAILEAFGKAFSNKDDVSLIFKAKYKQPSMPFEISLQDCLNDFYKKYPKHAEIKILSDYIEDMSELYRSVDCIFSMSHCECFNFPALESIASGKIAIVPDHGGQLDFLDQSNSLLISGKETRAELKSMYWESKNALWFEPSVTDAVDKLKYVYQNFLKLNEKVSENSNIILDKYSWNNVSNQFIGLCS